MKIKKIIFDFDGVLENTFEESYETICEIFEGITEEEYKTFFEGNIFEDKDFRGKKGANTKEVQNKFWAGYSKRTKLRDHNLTVSKEILHELFIMYDLFIITSCKESILSKIYLDSKDTKKYFKNVYGFEAHKSKVEKFKILLEEENISPEECLFITDTLGDIKEANEVNIKTIGVTWGFHNRERLEKGNCETIIDSPKEIIKAIRKIEKRFD